MTVHEDFPRSTLAGAVGGAAPKFLARETEGGTESARSV